MASPPKFEAPWCGKLKILTVTFVIVVIGSCVAGFLSLPSDVSIPVRIAVLLPLLIIPIMALFMVRSYSVGNREVRVQRLLWADTIPLSGLIDVSVDSQAMDGAVRKMGNGGLFCFAGNYYSQRLGDLRVLGTDPSRAVVLKFHGRAVVLTPENPEAMAKAIRRVF